MHDSKAKSAVTNGSCLLPGVDARTRPARRLRDILDAFVVEFDPATESEMTQAREAALLTLSIEEQATRAALGQDVDEGMMITKMNTKRRLLNDLRRLRKPRGA